MTKSEREEWRAIREKVGSEIDPDTAEVCRVDGEILDPYGIDPKIPDGHNPIGTHYFARSPESDIWVLFEDLPRSTQDALWEKVEGKAGISRPPTAQVTKSDREERLAIRKKAAGEIDPETAVVCRVDGKIHDSYDLDTECEEVMYDFGTYYFARSPESHIWVLFEDLPRSTQDALWEKVEGKAGISRRTTAQVSSGKIKEEDVVITLPRARALVLFEFLARFNPVERLEIQDQAEERVLSDVLGDLESVLLGRFRSDYDILLEKAREAVRDERDCEYDGAA